MVASTASVSSSCSLATESSNTGDRGSAMTPVRDASMTPKGLHSLMKDVMRSGLAHSSMMTESEETSSNLPSNRRVNSVSARKCSEVSRSLREAVARSCYILKYKYIHDGFMQMILLATSSSPCADVSGWISKDPCATCVPSGPRRDTLTSSNSRSTSLVRL